jgi:hypothetical protein
VFAAGSALGPYLMGVAFDAFRSYNPALAGFVAALLFATLPISRLRANVFPVEAADARPASRSLSREAALRTQRHCKHLFGSAQHRPNCSICHTAAGYSFE